MVIYRDEKSSFLNASDVFFRVAYLSILSFNNNTILIKNIVLSYHCANFEREMLVND